MLARVLNVFGNIYNEDYTLTRTSVRNCIECIMHPCGDRRQDCGFCFQGPAGEGVEVVLHVLLDVVPCFLMHDLPWVL